MHTVYNPDSDYFDIIYLNYIAGRAKIKEDF